MDPMINTDEIDYVLELETITSFGTTVVDANTSFIRKKGPASNKYAHEYFKEELETDYTNVYGVTNTIIVRNIYRRI